MTMTNDAGARAQAAREVLQRQRFVITSHVRPDGDAIGSQLAMAAALRHLGKTVRVVNRDPAPPSLLVFPGVAGIEITDRVDDPGDAVIVMESGDLLRTGVAGLERGFIINIDHHVGNTQFGAVNWFDVAAAACGEMVFDLVHDLAVPLTYEIALHVYIAVLTDTGSFHYSNITPRTFDICRRCVEAGVNPPEVARGVFDSNSLGRLKLHAAMLNRMQVDDTGRLATLSVDDRLVAECGGTYEDTEGLINLPLTVKEVQAVVFFKEAGVGDWRISMRSKGDVDINAVAREFGGGGHKNASGCSATGRLEDLKRRFQQKVAAQIDKVLAGSS
ncbi:MAG: bifunctional oligoribonuclease/PAP phosphatase NrnA [Acidobacteria bacterium]|nr:bifunctional oligoribonuclease/PAP phosphatase NrnA [Acidobacteriota bacterium]